LFVSERKSEQEINELVTCQPLASRLPKNAQPELDFIGKMFAMAQVRPS